MSIFSITSSRANPYGRANVDEGVEVQLEKNLAESAP